MCDSYIFFEDWIEAFGVCINKEDKEDIKDEKKENIK